MRVLLSNFFWFAFALWLCLAACSQKSSAPAGEAVQEEPQAQAPIRDNEDDEELFIILDEPRR